MYYSPRNENFSLMVRIKSLNLFIIYSSKKKKKKKKFTNPNKVLLVLGRRIGAHCEDLVSFTYSVFVLIFFIHSPCFRISVNFYTQIITILLPMHFTVSHVKEILDAHFLAAWHTYQCHSSRNVLIFWYPVCYQVICRGPAKISIKEEK